MQQIFRLLIFLIQPYMFRATNSPILRSTFWLYIQLFVNAPTLLSTGAVDEMELRSISTVAPADSSVGALFQKLYIQSKSAPEDGRICGPKYVVLN